MLMALLLGALAVLVGVMCWLVRVLHGAGALARVVEVASLDGIEARGVEPGDFLHESVRARARLQGFQDEQEAARCLAALGWLVEQFGSMAGDAADAGRAIDSRLFAPARRPHCGEIALLYCEVLAALGLQSRRVWLRKNLFDPHDSHVSVEVCCDGRWVLIDPTFNATFADASGNLLGAQQLKQLVFTGRRDAIEARVHGRALCPLALGDYYFDVLSCFNNVFVVAEGSRWAWSKVPPLRYFLGRRLLFEKLADESIAHVRVWQRLYGAAVLVLPSLVLLLGLLLGIVVAVGW